VNDDFLMTSPCTRNQVLRYLDRLEQMEKKNKTFNEKSHNEMKSCTWSSYFKGMRKYHFSATFSLLLCFENCFSYCKSMQRKQPTYLFCPS
jgi:hypothetical protein